MAQKAFDLHTSTETSQSHGGLLLLTKFWCLPPQEDPEAKDQGKDGEAKDGEAKDGEAKDGETKDGEGDEKANNSRKLTSKEKVQKALKAGRFKGWSWWWQFESFLHQIVRGDV